MPDQNEFCPSCGSEQIQVENVENRFAYAAASGTVELVAVIPVNRCAICACEFTTEEAEEIRHDKICKYLGRMTPAEIRNIRQINGWTRTDFAKISGFGPASLARWESGQAIQGTASDNLLYLLSKPKGLELLLRRESESCLEASRKDVAESGPYENSFVTIHVASEQLLRRQQEFRLH